MIMIKIWKIIFRLNEEIYISFIYHYIYDEIIFIYLFFKKMIIDNYSFDFKVFIK